MLAIDRTAYKPLNPNNNEDLELENEDDDEEDNIHMDGASKKYGKHFANLPSISTIFSQSNEYSRLGPLTLNLRHLRLMLLTICTLLFIVFMAQLSLNDRVNEKRSIDSSKSSKSESELKLQKPIYAALMQATNFDETVPITSNNDHDNGNVSVLDESLGSRPRYKGYISSILEDQNLQYQPIQYKLAQDDLYIGDIKSKPIWWTVSSRNSNEYITVSNYIRAIKSFNLNTTITLTTQATTEFMYHTLELCERWDGPISIAVYCPGSELQVAISLIKFMRLCLPSPLSNCIKDKVTWHLSYNRQFGPKQSAIRYPHFYLDSKNFPLFVNQDQCPKMFGPEPMDTIKQFEEKLRKSNDIWPHSFRQQYELPYPINVLRNTARLAAKSKYILASDIELYPSTNLVPLFSNYILHHNIKLEYSYIDNFIFTLPIFEVRLNVTAPKTKLELKKMFKNRDAIFFHKYVCDICQNFPNRLDWLRMNKFDSNESNQDSELSELAKSSEELQSEELEIFEITQRHKSHDSWEPIFIGTNDDPLYDDRLTWDGRRDKMGQMYELCLKNYYLLVVGNAFLVHAPGIKHIDQNDVRKRYNYIKANNEIYDKTMSDLKRQYANSNNINKC